MSLDKKILARFEDLVKKGLEIKALSEPYGDWQSKKQAFMGWSVSCKHLIAKVFGSASAHVIQFESQFKDAPFFDDEYEGTDLTGCLGVLQGALDDFKHEMLFNTRTAIEAEVFDDFLEQAQALFKGGYHQAAAVVAGAVLEDALRKICVAQNLAISDKATINPLNDELAKLGVYNMGWKKRIIALADTRNLAAHGKWDELNADDVKRMLRDIEDFMRREFEDAKAFVPT